MKLDPHVKAAVVAVAGPEAVGDVRAEAAVVVAATAVEVAVAEAAAVVAVEAEVPGPWRSWWRRRRRPALVILPASSNGLNGNGEVRSHASPFFIAPGGKPIANFSTKISHKPIAFSHSP
jgi:hypothetical protein